MIVWVSFMKRSLIVTISRYHTILMECGKPTWNWYDLLLCPTKFRFTAGFNRKVAGLFVLFQRQQYIVNNREHHHPSSLSTAFQTALLCGCRISSSSRLEESSRKFDLLTTRMKKSCWDRARSNNERNMKRYTVPSLILCWSCEFDELLYCTTID